MSRKTAVKTDDESVDLRYATKVQAMIDLIAPNSLAVIGGRGTTKTTILMARRSMDVIRSMPGSYQVFLADTYVNAMRILIPTLVNEGWYKEGWHEGKHFVADIRPPAHFDKPYKPPMSYKHTLSIYNGTFIQIGSADQPSSLAGNSYQHYYADEVRVIKFEKAKRISPAIRGARELFGHSPYYLGRTFMTDMPNILSGDDDWIYNLQAEMDLDQVKLCLEAGFIVNDIKIEFMAAVQLGDKAEARRLQKLLLQWMHRWYSLRKTTTLFYVISTLTNVDLLGDEWFFTQLSSLGPEEFKTAILSLPINIKQGEKFYANLSDHHFYDDGVNNEYYINKYSLLEAASIKESSQALRYIKHDKKLEAGVDFGDMLSLVTGQTNGNYLHILKDFHTLPPQSTRELADQFLEFYAGHKFKVLDLYYDRAGNAYSQIKRDWASELAKAIMFDKNGKPTGWRVNLMSVGQGNILQEEEYKFAKELLGETVQGLPKVRIDKFQCKHLKSSLELTKMLVKVDKDGVKKIHKDKSSEKLPMAKRPMHSTNFSDAFKYLVFRPEWVNRTRERGSWTGLSPSVG
ncbi:hypothetical protein ACLI1A_10165 [Flavobacterium sp. RHBU_3]|uniref:hypothetical protein n=1 Tax=Flavobacterium sp. RHBU_3 TaxID=3391184 RepID=UPI0039854347